MILIVDDFDPSRRALLYLVRGDGYQGHGAATGSEALAFLREATPGLVITDYNLPDINGLDIVHAMKADERLRGVPVVMFSATSAVREDALAAGADAFVLKGSLDWAELFTFIRRICGPGAPVATNKVQHRARKQVD